jgi:hypothetical protein
MDHHDDAKFFATRGAERFTEGRGTCEAHVICGETANHTFDQLALAGFEIAKEHKATATLDIDQFSGSQVFTMDYRMMDFSM